MKKMKVLMSDVVDLIDQNADIKGIVVHGKEFIRVVRCKDCIHYYADPWGYGNCVFEGGVSRRTKESDFCSWGEREEDANCKGECV